MIREAIVIVTVTTSIVVAGGVRAASTAELGPADRAAVFKAAGFKARGGHHIRCEEDPPTASYMPGRIEVADLNGDRNPEAWVTESSGFCYGATGAVVVLVTKDGGSWRKLLDEVGVALVLQTKRDGWPDIEVGGPGLGKAPVHRWNGKTYVVSK